MPITYDCACGKALRYKDEFAGKRTRCSGCNAVFTIPSKSAPPARAPREQPSHAKQSVRAVKKPVEEDDLEIDDDDDEPAPPRRPKRPRREDPADDMMEVVLVDDDEDDDEDHRPRKRRPRDEDDDDEGPRLVSSKRRKRRRKGKDDSASVNLAMIFGGILAIIGGAAWLIGGMMYADGAIFKGSIGLMIFGALTLGQGIVGTDNSGKEKNE